MNDLKRKILDEWFAGKFGELDTDKKREKHAAILAAVDYLETLEGQPIDNSHSVQITTQIASRTGEPWVLLRWGTMAGRLSPDEARFHAYAIMDGANAAETDAFLCNFLKAKLGVDDLPMAQVLTDFREYREAQRAKAKFDAGASEL